MKTNWPVKKLGEVTEIIGGGTPSRSNHSYWNGEIPWFTMSDLNDGDLYIYKTKQTISDTGMKNSNTRLIPLNSVILSCTASVGNVAINKIQLTTNQQFNSFICPKDLMPEFLAYYLKSIRSYIETLGGTTTFRFINRKAISQLEIPVPGIEEQRRIVKKIEKILARIEEAKRIRQKSSSETAQILKITLNKTFNGKKLNSKNKLYQVAKRIGGGTPSRSKREYFEGNIPWFTVTDLPENDGRLITIATPRQFITEDAVKHSATKLIPKGSVLLATRVGVGKVAIAGTDVTTNQDFSSFIPHNGLDNRFLGYFLLSQKHYFDQNSRGITIKGITTGVIDNMELSLPSLEEQGKIVAELDGLSEKVQALQKLQQEQLQDLEALQQSVLHQAFQGEL